VHQVKTHVICTIIIETKNNDVLFKSKRIACQNWCVTSGNSWAIQIAVNVNMSPKVWQRRVNH